MSEPIDLDALERVMVSRHPQFYRVTILALIQRVREAEQARHDAEQADPRTVGYFRATSERYAADLDAAKHAGRAKDAQIAAVTAERDTLERALDNAASAHAAYQREAEAECQALIGVIRADESRLRAAEVRVWPEMTFGCDAPDKLAEAILTLRADLARARDENLVLRQREARA